MSADPSSDEPSRHPVHFYDTGDVLLEVDGVLFRVHRERLCRESEVFKDMFELPNIGSLRLDETPHDIDPVVLHDDADAFALLLDLIYRLSFDYSYTKGCLQAALLGHKYEVQFAMGECSSYLQNYLPTGVASRDFHISLQYYDDISLTPLVLRAAELLDMPQVAPWALYVLTVQLGSSEDPRSGEEKSLVESFSAQMKAVRSLGQKYVKGWNKVVGRFMRSQCAAEWWVEEDDCWRRCELTDVDNSGFMLGLDMVDPLQGMYDALDFCCEGLCSQCADVWTEQANKIMEAFLENIEIIAM